MKIVVIGGTGLIGSKLVAKLRERGHEMVAASPASSVNTVRLAHVLVQPMAAGDAAGALADVAVGPLVSGIIDIAGPQQFHLDELARHTARAPRPARGHHRPPRAQLRRRTARTHLRPRRRRPPRRLAEPVHDQQQLASAR